MLVVIKPMNQQIICSHKKIETCHSVAYKRTIFTILNTHTKLFGAVMAKSS